MQCSGWITRNRAIIVPHRRGDVSDESVDRDTILTDLRDGHIHHLNETAALVWRLCSGKLATRDIARELTETYDITWDDALDQVDQLVVKFGESDLLESVTYV